MGDWLAQLPARQRPVVGGLRAVLSAPHPPGDPDAVPAHRIISRAEWGARHPDGAGSAPLPAEAVWLHHSVTIAPDVLPPFDDDFAAVRTLERIGQDRFGRGISYTFCVTPAGLIFEGHSVGRLGSHTAGMNRTHRAICLVGNYETDVPTEQQVDAAAWLLAHGFLAGWWRAVPLAGGHRDLKGTACPGRHAYATIPTINRRAAEMVRALATDAPADPEEDLMPRLFRISEGDAQGRIFALIDGREVEVSSHDLPMWVRRCGQPEPLSADGYAKMAKGLGW